MIGALESLVSSSITSYNNTSIPHKHHTHIYPLLNIALSSLTQVHVLNGLTRFTLLLFQESSSIRGQAQLCVALSAFGALLFPHPVLFVYIYLCHYSYRKVLPDFLNLQVSLSWV